MRHLTFVDKNTTLEEYEGKSVSLFAAVNEIYEKIYTNELGEKFVNLEGYEGSIGSDKMGMYVPEEGVMKEFTLESQQLITGVKVR